jgi:predicted Zn-ribbon and HTH transcriptional regulator
VVRDRPSVATETPRQAIRRLLAGAPRTARDLSALVHLPEKDIVPHLEHIARSLRGAGERLEIEPAQCHECGYVFRDRRRLSRPGACPRCRSERLSAPVFRITGGRAGGGDGGPVTADRDDIARER